MYETFVQVLGQLPSVVQELSSSQDFYGRHWLTLTFNPVSMSLVSHGSGNCDQFH